MEQVSKKVEKVVGLYNELCVVCKKKKCFYALVTEKGKEFAVEIHGICSAQCEQKFRENMKNTGFKKTKKEILKVARPN